MSDIEATGQTSDQEDLFNEKNSGAEDDLGLGLDGSDEEDNDIGVDNDNDNDNKSQGDNDDEDDNDLEGEPGELKYFDVSVPRHAKSNIFEDDVYTIKLPMFLNIDSHAFDPVEFKEMIELNAKNREQLVKDEKMIKNDLIRERLLNENTIRWRYTNENDEIIKQSNCHFIEWDDGSISLKIGNEMFDVKDIPLIDNLLVKSHDNLEILQSDSILTKSINLLPTSTGTSTHRQLTNAIKNLQQKDKILNTITDSDPLEVQRMTEENERKAIKMKRQLEMKRRLKEERVGRDSPAPGNDTYEGPSYERFNKDYNEDYDDEDDFIDNDEEEEEEGDDDDELDQGAERLRNLKKQGASKYDEDDEDGVEAEDEEGGGEATNDKESKQEDLDEENKRKRRRIIDSDDDE